MPIKQSRLGLVLLSCLAASVFFERSSEACSDTAWPFCPCSWETDVIPVYALTVGTGANRLQNLSPSRSAAEWERIITNALNIYREHAGIPVRLRFAGHTDTVSVGGAIVVRADTTTCDNYKAYTHFGIQGYDWDEIANADIELRREAVFSSCETINWDPRLLQQVTGYNRDPVNFLVHELGHAFGLHHPDNHCDEQVAAVMNSDVPVWGRHLSRDDKESLREHYGVRTPVGKTYEYQSNNTWSWLSNWPEGNGVLQYRPGVASSDGTYIVAAWANETVGTIRGKNSYYNSWFNISSGGQQTWNSPAVVWGGSSAVRVYTWYEWWTYPEEPNRKRLCYRESTDQGATWEPLTCPMPGGQFIMTRRDGIGAAFDWTTKNYVIVYTADDADCSPYCDKIIGLTQPGPGSSLTADKQWSLGHHTFSAPAVACRWSSTAANRCMIAFGTADASPYLRWQEGAPASGSTGGQWVQAADRYQTGIPLDQSPSVVWSEFDNRFHLATHRRYSTTSRIDTYYKNHSTGATWTGQWTKSQTSDSFSAPALGTFGIANEYMRMYYLLYQE